MPSDDNHFHYAGEIHGGAEEHHRHHDLEDTDDAAQREITALRVEVGDLRGQLADALTRIRALESPPREWITRHA